MCIRDSPLLLKDGPRPEAWQAQPLALYESEQRGVIAWPYKLLQRPAENLVEIYNLERDFEERKDLGPEDAQLRQRLLTLLAGMPAVDLDRSARGRWKREKRAAESAVDPDAG